MRKTSFHEGVPGPRKPPDGQRFQCRKARTGASQPLNHRETLAKVPLAVLSFFPKNQPSRGGAGASERQRFMGRRARTGARPPNTRRETLAEVPLAVLSLTVDLLFAAGAGVPRPSCDTLDGEPTLPCVLATKTVRPMPPIPDAYATTHTRLREPFNGR
jgi:hypothetical protein